jgi:hypothetical protein
MRAKDPGEFDRLVSLSRTGPGSGPTGPIDPTKIAHGSVSAAKIAQHHHQDEDDAAKRDEAEAQAKADAAKEEQNKPNVRGSLFRPGYRRE